MPSVLERFYPGLKMGLICKACRGSSGENLDKWKCPLCKKNRADYYKLGLQPEVEEFKYLYLTWCKVRNYNMATTGIKKLDCLIELLFGHPKTKDWRNYAKYPVREASPYVVLRTVNLGRFCEQEPEPA